MTERRAVAYHDGASEAEARAVGKALISIGYFAEGRPVSVGIRRTDGRAVVAFTVIDAALADPQMHQAFREIGVALSDAAFGGQPVDVWLVDDTAEPRVRLRGLSSRAE